MEKLPNRYLWSGIFGTNTPHVLGALLRCQLIHRNLTAVSMLALRNVKDSAVQELANNLA
jgi:hypothetical protein